LILSDYDLSNALRYKRIVITPLSKESIRENGIDFRLSGEIARHRRYDKGFVLDPENEEHVNHSYTLEKNSRRLIIKANEQVLLSTIEYIELPDDIMGFVELRSTWARHGISLPPTIIDAGFKGTVTLEAINNAPYAIALKPKQRFAHVIFMKTSNKVMNSYSGKYLGQNGIKLPKVLKKNGKGKDR
jgi:dCTP deaminase